MAAVRAVRHHRERRQEVGLTVTDDEVNNILKDGSSPLLQRDIPIPQFYNQQTGRFDYSIVQQFLADYDKAINSNPQMADQIKQSRDLWLYCENQLRHDASATEIQHARPGQRAVEQGRG